jgi:TPR repeat protein
MTETIENPAKYSSELSGSMSLEERRAMGHEWFFEDSSTENYEQAVKWFESAEERDLTYKTLVSWKDYEWSGTNEHFVDWGEARELHKELEERIKKLEKEMEEAGEEIPITVPPL